MLPEEEPIVTSLYVCRSTFSCLEHKSKIIQATDLKFYRWIRTHSGEVQCTRTRTLLHIFELLPFVVFSCPEHKSNIIQATDLRLHRWLDFMMENCNVQLPITYISLYT